MICLIFQMKHTHVMLLETWGFFGLVCFSVKIISCFITLENGNLRGIGFYCCVCFALSLYPELQTYAEVKA